MLVVNGIQVHVTLTDKVIRRGYLDVMNDELSHDVPLCEQVCLTTDKVPATTGHCREQADCFRVACRLAIPHPRIIWAMLVASR